MTLFPLDLEHVLSTRANVCVGKGFTKFRYYNKLLMFIINCRVFVYVARVELERRQIVYVSTFHSSRCLTFSRLYSRDLRCLNSPYHLRISKTYLSHYGIYLLSLSVSKHRPNTKTVGYIRITSFCVCLFVCLFVCLCVCVCVCVWRNSPTRARTATFLRYTNHLK